MIKKININKNLRPYFVFAIFVFMLYSNTLNHFFVFDDAMVITQNKFTQQGIKGIPDIFSYDTFIGCLQNSDEDRNADYLKENMHIVAGGRYRPLSLVTFALEVEFCGKELIEPNSNNEIQYKGNAFVSHLVNIILYFFTVCLLFGILSLLFPLDKDKKWYWSFPFITTLLFMSHPIHTEVVANIKGRDEIMALLCSLGALWFAIKYVDAKRTRHLVFSGLCMFLGLLSKENAITFLAVIPVTLYYFCYKNKRKIWIPMIPLIFVSTIFIFIRSFVLSNMDTSNIIPDIINNPFINATKSEALATVFYTLLLYVKLLFFPHPLTYDYYPYHIEIVNWSNPVALISILFYTCIGIVAVYGLIKKKDVCSYAIWFYLLPLSVVSNLFFPIGAFMGERFVFFSSIGFVVFIAWLIYTYIPQLTKNRKLSTRFVCAFMFIILLLYSTKTIHRNKAWKDNDTLFTTDIITSKNSIKGNLMVGSWYLKKAIMVDNFDESQRSFNNCEEAAQYLERTIQLYPQYPVAAHQLGALYFYCKRDVAKSLHYYAMALQFSTKTGGSLMNAPKHILSITPEFLENNGLVSTPEDIIASCDELLKVQPDIGEAYYLKGLICGKYLNNIELALTNLEQALAMDFPKTAKFYEYIGAAYGMSGNYSNAIQYLLKAVESGTDDYATYLNLGVIYQQLGDMENADMYTLKGNEIKNNIDNNH